MIAIVCVIPYFMKTFSVLVSIKPLPLATNNVLRTLNKWRQVLQARAAAGVGTEPAPCDLD